MNDREQLSALIDDIYDAALDPAQRIDVIDKIASFAGGQSGGILSKHSSSKSESLYCYIGANPESLQVYSESYPKLDLAADLPCTGVEQVVSTADLVPYEEFRRGRFYREWARPHGWGDVASVVIDKSATSCTFLSVVRDEARGPVDDEMRQRMALVVPHVRRALRIGKAVNLKQGEAACFSDILDRLSAGIIFVNAGGCIVHANAAGNAVLDAADILRAVSGRLVAGDAQIADADATRAAPLVVAGLLLGLATLVKPHAALWLPALAWAALRAARSGAVWRALALATGFGVPLVATWVAFAITGGAHDLLYWLVWRNVLYAANPITAVGAIERAASYLLPWLLATTPLWWAWRSSRPLLDAHRRRLIDGLVALGLLAALAGFRFFPHYFVPAVFALALGAGPAVARWCERPLARAGRLFLAASLVLALGFGAANAWLYLGGSNVYRETDPVYRAVAERLAADECFPGSRLFVWGWAPAFYYEAGLRGARPASRFAVLAQAGLTGYVPGNPDGARRREPGEPVPEPAHWDWLMADLERTPATYVLDTAPAGLYRWNRYPLRDYPRLDRYVAEGYERIGDVSRVRVYRRRGCAAR